MVHRKSEYRLQFHILANDLRKQIWLDNLKFRESCRVTNQSHHYWAYQVTEDPCECDKLALAQEKHDDGDDAPLPPHKLKHKFLLSMYGLEKSPQKSTSVLGEEAPPVSHTTTLNQQQVLTEPRSAGGELPPDSSRAVDLLDSKVFQDISAEYQSRLEPSSAPMSPSSPVPEPTTAADSTSVHPQPPVLVPEFRPFQPTPSHQSGSPAARSISPAVKSRQLSPRRPVPQSVLRGVQKSPDDKGRQLSPIRVSFPTPVVDYGAAQRTPPRTVTPSRNLHVGAGAQPSPSCLSHLSRTSRRTFSEERKKSPFTAFGWNDTNKDVGDKKTYNVSAPEAQVYENALRALKKRREEIEKYLAKESALRGHLSACDYGVNHSSIWMSEYKEKFGRGACGSFTKQPVTTPTVGRLNSLRCYS